VLLVVTTELQKIFYYREPRICYFDPCLHERCKEGHQNFVRENALIDVDIGIDVAELQDIVLSPLESGAVLLWNTSVY
jgi:hypothetical protein